MRSLLNDQRLLAKNFALCLLLLGLISCGVLTEKPQNREAGPEARSTASEEAAGLHWWRARFVRQLAAEEKPRWVSDLMVADLIIEPVLGEFASSLALWRFHRRAGHDGGGHAFSFIFYADRQTAGQVFAMIAASPDLARLKENGLIDKYENDLSRENQLSAPGATSDSNWSPALQEVWPAYIMGASVTWLGLINQYIEARGAAERDFAELVSAYEKVNQALGDLWRNEGQHAFLHHLNALFGYEPLQLQVETSF